MSASIAIAAGAGAGAQSAIAAQHAREAKIISCQGFVHGYKHDTATQQEMKQYAECTQLLLPSEPLSDGATIGVKVIIVFLLLCFIAGGAFGDFADGPVDRFMNGLLWAVGGVTFLVVSGAIIAGIGFLFS